MKRKDMNKVNRFNDRTVLLVVVLVCIHLILAVECKVVPATSLIGEITPIDFNQFDQQPKSSSTTTQTTNTQNENDSSTPNPIPTTIPAITEHQPFPTELNAVRKYVLKKIHAKLPFCGFEYPKNTKNEQEQTNHNNPNNPNNHFDVRLVHASKQELVYTDGLDILKKTESRMNSFGRLEYYRKQVVFGTNYFLTFDVYNHTKSTRYNITIFQDIEKLYTVTKCTHIPLHDENNNENNDNSDIIGTNANPNPLTNSRSLNILSYNIWNYNDPWNVRKDLLVNVTLENSERIPHIIAWQEMRYSEHKHSNVVEEVKEKWGGGRFQGEALLKGFHKHGLNYQYVYQPAMTYLRDYPGYEMEGLAIFSLFPIIFSSHHTLSRDIHDVTDEHQRICLHSRIKTNGGLIDIFVTHMSLSDRAQLRNIVEIWNFMKSFDLPDSSEKQIPQFLMGDMNNKPDSKPIKFLIGEHEINGERGDLTDIWNLYRKKDLVCDEYGECTNSSPESDGFTFNTLNEELTSRIDFIFSRNINVETDSTLRLSDFHLIGRNPLQIDKDNDGEVDKEIFASDHLGLLTQFAVTVGDPKR